MATILWLSQLKKASWRGIPFHVDSIDASAGDDVVIREYPFQDLPTFQRMGEGAEEFSIRAYVIGSDYIQQRDALEQKLRGEGVLIHPTRGHIRCWVNGKYQVSESPTAEGGIARFDIKFVRAEPRRYPIAVFSTFQQLLDAIASAIQSFIDGFVAFFRPGGAGWVIAATLQAVNSVIDTLETVMDSIYGAGAVLGGYKAQVMALRSRASSLMDSPAELATAITTAMAYPRDADPDLVLRTVKSSISTTLKRDRSPFNTASRAQLEANNQQLERLLQRMQFTLAAAAMANKDAIGWREAKDLRAWFSTQAMIQLQQSDSYTVTVQLTALRTAIIRHLQQHPDASHRVFSYTPSDTQPLLYISYRLYGTIAYADEIYRNNPHITHPTLVPAGKQLTVLSHD